MPQPCYCGSHKDFTDCCQPLITHQRPADSAEQLMRSRFSAYCIKAFEYVLATYAPEPRQQLSISELEQSDQGTRWIGLTIVPTTSPNNDTVEFRAFYMADGKPGQLHETSRFIKEENEWRYLDGELHSDCGRLTIGRNDPCLCKSGKKFKQCCMRS